MTFITMCAMGTLTCYGTPVETEGHLWFSPTVGTFQGSNSAYRGWQHALLSIIHEIKGVFKDLVTNCSRRSGKIMWTKGLFGVCC